MNQPSKKEIWHFDKGIPLSVIFILILQTASAIWYLSAMSKQIEDNKHRIEIIESQRFSERLTSLESQMIDSKGSLVRIENKLDRLIEKNIK